MSVSSNTTAVVAQELASTTSEDEQSTAAFSDDKKDADKEQTSDVIPKDFPLKKGVIKELSPVEIRWFYKPPVKNSSWIPFKGRDSLLIELKYRIHNEQLLGEDFPGKETALQLCKSSIVVLDGYYEFFFVETLEVKPIYWEGDSMKVLRGSWFLDSDWRPLTEKMAQSIEEEHLKMFTGQKIPEGPVYSDKGQKPVLKSIELEDMIKVEWNSVIDVTMVTNRTWTTYFRLKSNIIKLRRGYHTEALMSDGPLPVDHLVFVVHGIGQKRQVNRIVTNTIGMRSVADLIINKKYKCLTSRPLFVPVEWRTSLKLDEGIVEAITPSKIETVRSLLNSTLMDIMYYNSPKYRSEVTEGLLTVLNKLYDKFMQHNTNFRAIQGKISIFAHSLGAVISYDVITGWSPLQQYEDFVTQRLKVLTDSPTDTNISKEHLLLLQNAKSILQSKDDNNFLKLLTAFEANNVRIAFEVDNLFCLGSPLGVFLALRGQLGAKLYERNPPMLYNIFHPHDPVAYRLEPLVHPLYSKIRPLRIHRYDSRSQTPYAEMPMELSRKDLKRKQSKDKSSPPITEVAVAMQSDDSDGRLSPGRLTDIKSSQAPKKTWSFANFPGWSKIRGGGPVTSNPNTTMDLSPTQHIQIGGCASSSGSTESLTDAPDVSVSQVIDADPLSRIPPDSRLPYRFDYMIRESKLDYGFLSTLTSHTSYWTDYDVIAFLITQIYGLPAESDNKLDMQPISLPIRDNK